MLSDTDTEWKINDPILAAATKMFQNYGQTMPKSIIEEDDILSKVMTRKSLATCTTISLLTKAHNVLVGPQMPTILAMVGVVIIV